MNKYFWLLLHVTRYYSLSLLCTLPALSIIPELLKCFTVHSVWGYGMLRSSCRQDCCGDYKSSTFKLIAFHHSLLAISLRLKYFKILKMVIDDIVKLIQLKYLLKASQFNMTINRFESK